MKSEEVLTIMEKLGWSTKNVRKSTRGRVHFRGQVGVVGGRGVISEGKGNQQWLCWMFAVGKGPGQDQDRTGQELKQMPRTLFTFSWVQKDW
jgi:hypothetical protein